MIIDLSNKKSLQISKSKYDICIVGSGPAGLTIANELANSNLRVCVLESGKKEKAKYADSLKKVASTGIQIKQDSRERIFGGTSHTWSGLSSIFNKDNLEEKDYLPNSSWPISYEELLNYYDLASKRYDFPDLNLFLNESGNFNTLTDLDIDNLKGGLNFQWKDIKEKLFIANNNPQRFAKKFSGIFKQDNVDLYLNATLNNIIKNDKEIDSITVENNKNEQFKFIADKFILATGGIENARILLHNNIGNENDQVGRYLMNHPKINYGTIYLNEPVKDAPYYFGALYGGWSYAGFELSKEYREKNNLLNSYIRFEPVLPWSGNLGVESFVTIVKKANKLLSYFLNRRKIKSIFRKIKIISIKDYSEIKDYPEIEKKGKIFTNYLKLIWNITIHLPSVLIYIFYKLVPNTSPKIHKINLRQFMEMAPNKENKIYLDENGIPTVKHYIMDIDKRSMVELNNILKTEIENLNIGKVEISFEKDSIWQTMQDASHHIGTTRMGNDSKNSVIDSNAKVHNIKNLYIAGASVFPTSGSVNPTYTIVALSIRLAEHIKNNIKNSYDKNYHDLSHDNSYSRPIMMIGAGRRFNNDILPVLELLENKFYINKIFSRKDNIIFSKNKHKTKTYSVFNIEKLNEKNISNTKYIYISVPYEQVESILKKLSQYDCSNIELIVDTPVIKKFKEYFIFKKVHIAEDSVFLPWIDLLKNQKIKNIYFDRSIYAYHGISLIKKINQKQSHIYGFRFFNKIFLNFKNSKMKIKISEPRDYDKGEIFINGEEYPIKLFNSKNKIILKFKEKEVSLNEVEKSLFGELKEENQDTIISRMHDLKRVGLYRLLNSIYDTGNSWSLDAGISDYKIDRNLHKKYFTN